MDFPRIKPPLSRTRKIIRGTALLVLLLFLGVGVWSFFIEPNRLVIHQVAIQIDNWPKELSGLRIAMISDIHTGGPFIFEQNGLSVLDNEVAEIKWRNSSFWIVGLADLWTRPQRIEETIDKVPYGSTIVAITHNPDIFPHLPRNVQILLAGHT